MLRPRIGHTPFHIGRKLTKRYQKTEDKRGLNKLISSDIQMPRLDTIWDKYIFDKVQIILYENMKTETQNSGIEKCVQV